MLLFIASSDEIQSQGTNCNGMTAICAEEAVSFPVNSTGGGIFGSVFADPGNDYSCGDGFGQTLWFATNPSWYYVTIDESGSVNMEMESNLTLNYALYGPFDDLASATADCGSMGPPIDCNFTISPSDASMAISGEPGQIYVLMVSNYANQPGEVTISQTGGSGTTDCTGIEIPEEICDEVEFPTFSNTFTCNGPGTDLEATIYSYEPYDIEFTMQTDTWTNLENTVTFNLGGITYCWGICFSNFVGILPFDGSDFVETYSGVVPGDNVIICDQDFFGTSDGEFYSSIINTDTGDIIWDDIFNFDNSNVNCFTVTFPPTELPVNGIWSGPGVSDYGEGDGYFDPIIAGAGEHTIVFEWDQGNGCTGIEYFPVTVQGTQNAVFTLPTQICLPIPGNMITPGFGGSFGGTWGNSYGLPMNPANGAFDVSSIYETTSLFVNYTVGSFPCESTHSAPIILFVPGDPDWELPESLCEDESPILLTPLNDYSGEWSGNGVTDNGDGTAYFDPQDSGPGNYTITYSMSGEGGCTASLPQLISVFEIPVIQFDAISVCQKNELNLEGLENSLYPGIWSGEGVSFDQLNPIDLTGNYTLIFTPSVSCAEPVNVNLVVLISEEPEINDTTLCINEILDITLLNPDDIAGEWVSDELENGMFEGNTLGSFPVSFVPEDTCDYTVDVIIEVINPEEIILSDTSVCIFNSINLYHISPDSIQGIWNGLYIEDSLFVAPDSSGVVEVEFIPDASCIDPFALLIELQQPAIGQELISSLCFGDSLLLPAIMEDTIAGNWSGIQIINNTFYADSVGVFDLIFDSDSLCLYTTIQEIEVIPFSEIEIGDLNLCNTELIVLSDFYNAIDGNWFYQELEITEIEGNSFPLDDQLFFVPNEPCYLNDTVDVIIHEFLNAGDDSSATYCDTDAIDLNALLSSDADDSGVWFNDSGVEVNANTGQLSANEIFVYTFANQYCPLDSAAVTITIQSPMNLGQDEAVEICEIELTMNLNDYLLTPIPINGQWSIGGIDLVSPIIDFADYGIIIIAEFLVVDDICGDQVKTLEINIADQIFAGANSSEVLCNNPEENTELLLDNLLETGIPLSGTWIDELNVINFIANNTIDVLGTAVGTYELLYVLETQNACPSDTSEYLITVNDCSCEPLIATFDPPTNVCVGSSDTLFFMPLLSNNATLNGSWTVTTDQSYYTNDYLLLADLQVGIYTIEYMVAPNDNEPDYCVPVSSNQDIEIVTQSDAGVDEILTFCETIGLITMQDYAPLSIPGIFLDDQLIPIATVDTQIWTSGDAVFFVAESSNVCPNDTALYEIYIDPIPDAGDNNSATYCEIELSFDLSDLVNVSNVSDGVFYDDSFIEIIPIIDISSVGEFDYFFVIESNNSCQSDTAMIEITVDPALQSLNSESFQSCNNEGEITIVDLTEITTALSNYSWSTESELPVISDEVDVLDVVPGNYEVFLVQESQNSCSSDTTTIQIQVEDCSINCSDLIASLTFLNECFAMSDEIDLIAYLDSGSDESGSWTVNGQNNSSASVTIGNELVFGINQIDYLLQAPEEEDDECLDLLVQEEFVISEFNDAGEDSSSTLCEQEVGEELNLNDLTGQEDIGNWYQNNGMQINGGLWPLSNAGIGDYSFYFVVQYNASCEPDTTQLDLNIVECNEDCTEISLTFLSNNDTYCNTGTLILASLIEDFSPQTGQWFFENENFEDAVINLEILDIGAQTLTYVIEPPLNDPSNCEAEEFVYSFTIMDCEIESEIVIPSAFSPNQDGYNDVFTPLVSLQDIVYYELAIYNRWGDRMFESYDENLGWNGDLQGEPVEIGVYVYVLTIHQDNQPVIDMKGSVTLVR